MMDTLKQPFIALQSWIFEQWLQPLLFTLEYLARLACVERPLRYAKSFFGIVDLLSVAPTYLAFFFPDLHALIDIRLLRMLRVFRIFKITTYMTEYRNLGEALWAVRRRIVDNEVRDFRLMGADLPEDRKPRFKAIQEELSGPPPRAGKKKPR